MMALPDILALINDFEAVILIAFFLAVLAFRRRLVGWLKGEMGIDEIKADVLRNTLLLNLNNSPDKAEVIEADYARYKSYGGNGYIDNAMVEWRRSYESQLIAHRLGVYDGPERRGSVERERTER
jgi:hypothetical protein